MDGSGKNPDRAIFRGLFLLTAVQVAHLPSIRLLSSRLPAFVLRERRDEVGISIALQPSCERGSRRSVDGDIRYSIAGSVKRRAGASTRRVNARATMSVAKKGPTSLQDNSNQWWRFEFSE